MTEAQTLDLAVLGNGRSAALVDPMTRILWWCFPNFDGDPVFCRLLAGEEDKGFTDVVLHGFVESRSEYMRNTAIVSTVLWAEDGSAVRITDFAPRFQNLGRIYRPPQLMRIIEPVSGLPRITIRCRPTHNYGEPVVRRTVGSNHIRYEGAVSAIRLTTDASLASIENESPFVLTRTLHMVFGADETFTSALDTTVRDFLERTTVYWQEWVRRLSIGYEWQDAVIRAAISLKLSNFEETGAIVAALTTSIPEAPHSGRNWDYRYCWMRDAYFVVKALNRIGATGTMESFISFCLDIAADQANDLKPCYGIVHTAPMDEYTVPALSGYRGHGPVRVGNAAATQNQHDTYGSIILAALPMFFDRRLPKPGDEALFRLLERLGNRAGEIALEPDAGIWEYRGRRRVHTYSAAMCAAGCDRLGAIAAHLGFSERAQHWNKIAGMLQTVILERAWNAQRNAFCGALEGHDLDASVLLLPELGLIDAKDPRFVATVAAVEKELLRERHVMRYMVEDDFGLPESAFIVCRFWLVDAFWQTGRLEEARALFVDALNHRNRYGLLSEDIDPHTGALWGNFPQTYSMAGLILSAMRLSRSWEDRYWHVSS